MTADQEAASILRRLLRDEITPEEAARVWPQGRVSQPSARSYIDYFRDGLDGRGGRDPQVDKMVADLATLLERGSGAWDPATESWQAAGQPVDKPRTSDEVMLRMVASLLAFERTQIDTALSAGEMDFKTADREAGTLSGGVRYLFGTDALEDDERAVLYAPTGKLTRSDSMSLHWRIECVGVLAWSLGKVAKIPKPSERFDYVALQDLTKDLTPDAIRAAAGTRKLRPVKELVAARAWYRKERIATRDAIVGHPSDKERQLQHSRALERYRALVWLLNAHYPSLGETSADP